MFRETELHWSTSLLTKMTGVVLWTLMLLMFLLALFVIRQQTRDLKAQALSRAETVALEVMERYKELLLVTEGLDRILENELRPGTYEDAATDGSEALRALREQDRRGFVQSLQRDNTDGEIAGVVLVTMKGEIYSSGGNPDVIDFLEKQGRAFLGEQGQEAQSRVREYRHLYTLAFPIRADSGSPNGAITVALSKDLLRQEVISMRKEVFLIITVVVVLLSFPIIYFLRKWVVQPIHEITHASKEISDGNFGKRIPVVSSDEIGFLAKNFNKMAASLNFRDERLSRSYERIQSLKEYYDSIISNAPVGIVSVDKNACVAFENPAIREILYPLKERSSNHRGRKIVDIPSLQDTRIREVLGKIMSGEIVEEEGFKMTKPSGEQMVLSLKGVPLLDEQHFIHSALLIFVDITRRTALEERLKKSNVVLEKTVQDRTEEILRTNEKLRQSIDDLYRTNRELVQASRALQESNEKIAAANRMKTEFLASMSHELRTPLNAIIGFSDLILSGIDGPISEKQREDLEAVSRSGRNLLHLINDILDLSKIEAGKVSMKKKVMDIRSILSEIAPMVRNVIGHKPVEFRTSVQEGIRFFYADEKKILQILLNLISNAAKFTDQGEISLSVTRSEPQKGEREKFLQFTVADTGIGIQEQEAQVIFDEFKQIDHSSRNAEGSGLGLSITKKLVELGGGKIWVEGRRGGGTCFHFTVPVSSENVSLSASR